MLGWAGGVTARGSARAPGGFLLSWAHYWLEAPPILALLMSLGWVVILSNGAAKLCIGLGLYFSSPQLLLFFSLYYN